MRAKKEMHRGTDPLQQFRVRVQHEWRRALVRALNEPASEDEHAEEEVPSTPIEQLAARAVADAWPEVEDLVRPFFEPVNALDLHPEAPLASPADPPSITGLRPAAWLSAEEVAPLLHMTAPTLRRLARTGECPIVVRRIGGRWCFSRSDLQRLVETTR